MVSKARVKMLVNLTICILSIGFFLYPVFNSPTTGGLTTESVKPYDWPQLLLISIFVLSIISFITSLRESKANNDSKWKLVLEKKIRKSIIVAFELILYVILFRVTGFIFGTWSWLAVNMVREKRWYVAIGIATAIVALLHIIFIKVLCIPLPRGMLFFETLSRVIGH